MPDEADKPNATTAPAGPLDVLVSWPPERRGQDDIVYIYRHPKKGVLVYGHDDAGKYTDKLLNGGYKHTATLSASTFIECIANKNDIHDVWDAVHFIDS